MTQKETPKELFLSRFIAYRKHFNQRQGDWAALVKRERTTFSRAEHGQAPFLVDFLLDIAEEKGFHPAEFFCFNPDTHRVEYPNDAAYLKEIATQKKTIEILQARLAQVEAAGGGRKNLNRSAAPAAR